MDGGRACGGEHWVDGFGWIGSVVGCSLGRSKVQV